MYIIRHELKQNLVYRGTFFFSHIVCSFVTRGVRKRPERDWKKNEIHAQKGGRKGMMGEEGEGVGGKERY